MVNGIGIVLTNTGGGKWEKSGWELSDKIMLTSIWTPTRMLFDVFYYVMCTSWSVMD